jgi:hypothetical protein
VRLCTSTSWSQGSHGSPWGCVRRDLEANHGQLWS